ncbi:hypothetical protein PSENEW3_00004362 [Picochlorum sp. SENEW3]|nr:hypothetical protein PSENEW3_00004362 [Picochlorum sp. SENEW3]
MENGNDLILHAHVNQGEHVPTRTAVVFLKQRVWELSIALEQLSMLQYKPCHKTYSIHTSARIPGFATRTASLVGGIRLVGTARVVPVKKKADDRGRGH